VVTSIDERERLALCDLLVELGPDAPTLCEGWTTLDLAAHLVLREHFRRGGEERLAAEKAKGLPRLVERLRAGAPLVPWRVPGVRTLVNGVEYFIHHEDVRRANGLGPRPRRSDLEDLSWRVLGVLGRRPARRMRPLSLTLVAEDGRHRSFGSGEEVTLRGPASELLLYLSGRRDAAAVEVAGSAEAVGALEAATTGL
jgi:uncharacterized protein (TIGR03085 family)